MGFINGVYYCDSQEEGYIQSKNLCPFKPAATKRGFLWKKGEVIENVSANLDDLTYWEGKIKDGTLVPLVDSTVSDVTANPQTTTVGIREYKLSDGESAFSFRPSVVACQVEEYAKLESNSSMYDLFIVTEANQLIGKYDAEADTFAPMSVNSIDVRSKEIVSDGTTEGAILDTVIVRYLAAQEKGLRYFDIPDTVANITGLSEARLTISNVIATGLDVDVRTKCEGTPVTGLTAADFLVDGVAATAAVEGPDGFYALEATIAGGEMLQLDDVVGEDVFSNAYVITL